MYPMDSVYVNGILYVYQIQYDLTKKWETYGNIKALGYDLENGRYTVQFNETGTEIVTIDPIEKEK